MKLECQELGKRQSNLMKLKLLQSKIIPSARLLRRKNHSGEKMGGVSITKIQENGSQMRFSGELNPKVEPWPSILSKISMESSKKLV